MMTTSIDADCDNKTTTKNRSIKKSTGASSSSSVFDDRTEEASAIQYFQFYGFLSQQQNMMQDYVRTATYQRAILANSIDFKNKVVMDVGAGSGILSFFAIQAGAKLVYAIEASSMAKHCETLVASNGLTDRIRVIAGKVEDVRVPELVDVIISEPMGYMLVNERMLETYLHSKKFLKPGGRMFPTRGDLHLALFSDEALYLEQTTKASFWCQQSFHGVNLSDLRPQATTEYFRQPIVDTWHIASLLTQSHKWSINFETADERDLHIIDIPFELIITRSGMLHGIAFWFDVAFIGGSETVWLSTAPTEPLTHWYQVRCLLDPNPIVAHQGQTARGRVLMTANDRQSYDIEIEVTIDGTTLRNTLDLKNPYFRYTGQPVMPPPGMNNESPSDIYWQTSSSLPMTATTSNGLSTATTSAIAQQQQHQQSSSLFASFLPPTVANNNDNNRSMMMNGTVPPNIMDMLANAHAAYRGVGIQSGVMTQPNLQHQQQQQQFVQHPTNRNVTPITNTHQHNVLTKSPEPIYSQLIQNQQQQQISAPIMQHHQMPTVGQFGAPNFSTSQLQSDQQQQSSSSTASSSANYRPWTMH